MYGNLLMMINVLIDTNVLIYGLDKSSLYHRPAATILTSPDLDLFVTAGFAIIVQL